jgi:hypothetical protein
MIGTVFAIPLQQESGPQNLYQVFLRDLRNDVEILANRVFGGGSRPDTWSGSEDYIAEDMLGLLFLDYEQLADTIFGIDSATGLGIRPDEWFGASSYVPEIVARNIRHDLEIAADTWLGENLRPDGWVGASKLYRCDRNLMNVLLLLDMAYNLRPVTPETVLDYCPAVLGEVEDVLIPEALGDREDIANLPSLILTVRGDLERLADEALGVNVRPQGWLDNTDVQSESFYPDLEADLNRLADIILQNRRPEAWEPMSSFSEASQLRTLRFNLELLADIHLGFARRPNNWQGESELFRCEPALQNLVILTQRAYQYEIPQTDAEGPAYCAQINVSVNFAVENPPTREEQIAYEATIQAFDFNAESQNAFSYLDLAAIEYMGVMPWGTKFRAWYRNFGESTMMFVSGPDFAVYIDRRWTTLSEDTFAGLPTLEGRVPLTFCDAEWCNGPAPTPTPTGRGPILDIINANTPPAEARPPATADADTTGKRQVTWNQIRIDYLLFRPEIGEGVVQATLEICTDASQSICEPVVSVYNTVFDQPVPVVSTTNGLNVYELPYGYRTEFLIEGDSLFSIDVWVSDPSLQGG